MSDWMWLLVSWFKCKSNSLVKSGSLALFLLVLKLVIDYAKTEIWLVDEEFVILTEFRLFTNLDETQAGVVEN